MKCPVCKRYADVTLSGNVMWHKDGIGKRCEMVGHPYPVESQRVEAA
ncbi:hypothetical protein CCUG60885_04216 [Mycobacteroides salmoniphilum]|uniref:Uncharacterized protein n=1 Tax=Mycobacteroides salmoniphilum TaxID=404941 RepID=A0A4R8SBZ4_9MYCO|nr:hypothetical protein CCUG60885_04216 [Mycobacteroides salmoniphilum]TEA07332.1 hypothetical protein CCUG60883_01365 [Mycobacteroides salmoniphilum]